MICHGKAASKLETVGASQPKRFSFANLETVFHYWSFCARVCFPSSCELNFDVKITLFDLKNNACSWSLYQGCTLVSF